MKVVENVPGLPLKVTIKLPDHIESLVVPMLECCPKLRLTGSSVLYMLGVLQREPHDIDFSLTEELTEYELAQMTNLFDLKVWAGTTSGDGGEIIIQGGPESTQKPEMFIFMKEGKTYADRDIKIDIFNKEYLQEKDEIIIDYNGEFIIKATHPSIPLSYKARYLFDPRVGANDKHREDVKSIMDKIKDYFSKVTTNISPRRTFKDKF